MSTSATNFALLNELWTNPRIVSLLALLLIAAVCDWRSYRIPNWLTLTGVISGLAYNALLPATSAHGLSSAMLGMLLCFALGLPLYLSRAMGAGDVKLMAMVGAFLGASEAWYAMLSIFITGGVAAVAFAIWHGALGRLLNNIRMLVQVSLLASFVDMKPDFTLCSGASIGKLPYAVSIGIGTLAFVAGRQLELL